MAKKTEEIPALDLETFARDVTADTVEKVRALLLEMDGNRKGELYLATLRLPELLVVPE